MGSHLYVTPDDSISIRFTHSNLKSFSSEVQLSLQTHVGSVKEKLWRKSGTTVGSMRLDLYDDVGAKICELDDDMRPLGFYPLQDGFQIHIVDMDPLSVTVGCWLEDTSLVEKYTISDEAYNNLDDTYRKFKEKLVAHNLPVNENKVVDDHLEDLSSAIKVGDRCEVEPGGKRGTVKFVGRPETVAPGLWIGVHYDEPLGKHDGMVKGKRYFECPPRHGALVRPDKVKVGNYLERDLFEDEEI